MDHKMFLALAIFIAIAVIVLKEAGEEITVGKVIGMIVFIMVLGSCGGMPG